MLIRQQIYKINSASKDSFWELLLERWRRWCRTSRGRKTEGERRGKPKRDRSDKRKKRGRSTEDKRGRGRSKERNNYRETRKVVQKQRQRENGEECNIRRE